MCGIAGYWRPGDPVSDQQGEAVLRAMGMRIARRGPDDDGYYLDARRGLGLVHRRLAIVDLSPTGAQPMLSHSGRYRIVFNGEIYNFRELRARLSAPWRGTGDTEVLVAAIDAWGIEQALAAAVGQFAFALWDEQDQCLTLGRDRLGEKPLYYGWQGTGAQATLLFGSDLAALRAHPAFSAEIDRDALAGYMRHNNVSGTASIYQGIHKVAPGTIRRFSAGERDGRESRYWSLETVIEQGIANPFTGSLDDMAESLNGLLTRAISEQMLADVPLGAFLSGGVDSSLIAALMQSQAGGRVKTFSIGFEEEGFNEADHARAVAAHLGTDHTELFVTARDALDLIPQLPQIYAEPFADSSQIPTHLLARMTREHVTVALSGDAGDELFCGYRRYAHSDHLWPRLSRWPRWMRWLAGRAVLQIPPVALDRAGKVLGKLAPAVIGGQRVGDRAHKGAKALASRDIQALYSSLISHWSRPEQIVLGGHERTPGGVPDLAGLAGLSPVDWMMAQDQLGYMCDDVLTKVDRAAMAASLETRVPLLDHRIVEFAWSLPVAMKRHGGQSKFPLRQLLYRHVPRTLIERPKAGFAVPIGDWLRGPLRDWAEDLLDEGRLRREGLLDPVPLRAIWAEHLSGRRNWHDRIWTVLMFQAWLAHSPGGPARCA